MKCAALLKGSGSLLSSIRLIPRCTGKNVSKNRPAKAIISFLEIEENKTLLIGYKMFIVYFFTREKEVYQS
jgi:hypothetical protein